MQAEGTTLPLQRKKLGGRKAPPTHISGGTVAKVDDHLSHLGSAEVTHHEIFGKSPRSNAVAKESQVTPWVQPRHQLKSSVSDAGLVDIFGTPRRISARGLCQEAETHEASRVASQWPKPGAEAPERRLRAAASAPPGHLRGMVYLNESEGEPTIRTEIFGQRGRVRGYADGCMTSDRMSSEPPADSRYDLFASTRRVRGAGEPPPDRLADGCEVKAAAGEVPRGLPPGYVHGMLPVFSDGIPLQETPSAEAAGTGNHVPVLSDGAPMLEVQYNVNGAETAFYDPAADEADEQAAGPSAVGSSRGHIFRPIVDYAFGPATSKYQERSWRKLVEKVWTQPGLSSEAKEILQEFHRRADKAEQEQVARYRRRQEHLDKAFKRMRPAPSPRYLELRSKEHHLAKQARYLEAAQIRDEAQRMRTQDDHRFITELEPQANRMKASLQRKEHLAWRELQQELYEELAGLLYHGLAPFPRGYD